ncbi:LacI family DNA-binding transcriptional regulator [Globicatella sanguinis]
MPKGLTLNRKIWKGCDKVKITIKDIAKLANVSTTTVSNVMIFD